MLRNAFLKYSVISLLFVIACPTKVCAQSTDLDSLSILDLIDSLLSLEENKSFISFRLSHQSRTVYAGRELGSNQSNVIPGIAYYHKSGVFADITGYWNDNTGPQYNLTTTTVGYMGDIKSIFSYMLSYDHSFFSGDAASALTNSLITSGYLNFKHFESSLDYSFLFGEETAHRLQPGINGRITFKHIGFIKKLSLSPGGTVLFGNGNISSIRLFESTNRRGRRRRRFALEEDNVFGVMNYSMGMPVTFSFGQLGLIASYYYNIPVALPGERNVEDSYGYTSITLSYLWMR